MADYSTRNIIDYAMDDNGVEFRKSLYGSIHDKVAAHIEAAKQAIAQNLISQKDDSYEDSNEDESVEG